MGDPFCSNQTAIDNAVDTDEIIVAEGTYLESIDFLGKAIRMYNAIGSGPTVTSCTFGANTPNQIFGEPIIDGGGNIIGVFCPPPTQFCPADLDGDGTVGITDFLGLLAAWGPCP